MLLAETYGRAAEELGVEPFQDAEALTCGGEEVRVHSPQENALMIEIEYAAKGFTNRGAHRGCKDAFKACADATASALCALFAEIGFDRFSLLLNGRLQRQEKWLRAEAKFPELVTAIVDGGTVLKPPAPHPPAGARYPRVGAFEVTVYDLQQQVHKVLFSKYKMHRLPASTAEILVPFFPFLVVFAATSDDEDLLRGISMAAHSFDVALPVGLEDLLPKRGTSSLVDVLIEALEEVKTSLATGDPELIGDAVRGIPFGLHTREVDEVSSEKDRLEALELPISGALQDLKGRSSPDGLAVLQQAVDAAQQQGLAGEVLAEGKRRLELGDAPEAVAESQAASAQDTPFSSSPPLSASAEVRDDVLCENLCIVQEQHGSKVQPVPPLPSPKPDACENQETALARLDRQIEDLRERVVEAAASMPLAFQLPEPQPTASAATDLEAASCSEPESQALASLRTCLESLLGQFATTMAASTDASSRISGREATRQAVSSEPAQGAAVDSNAEGMAELSEVDYNREIAQDIALAEISEAVITYLMGTRTPSEDDVQSQEALHNWLMSDQEDADEEVARCLMLMDSAESLQPQEAPYEPHPRAGRRQLIEADDRRRKELPPRIPYTPPVLPQDMWEPYEEIPIPLCRAATPTPYDEVYVLPSDNEEAVRQSVLGVLDLTEEEALLLQEEAHVVEGIMVAHDWSPEVNADAGDDSTLCLSSSCSSAALLTSPMFSLTSSPVPSRRGSRILLGFSLDAGSGTASSSPPTLPVATTQYQDDDPSEDSPQALEASMLASGVLRMPAAWADEDARHGSTTASPVVQAIVPASSLAEASSDSTVAEEDRWLRRIPPGASLGPDGIIWGEGVTWPPSAALRATLSQNSGLRRGSRALARATDKNVVLIRRHSAPPRQQQRPSEPRTLRHVQSWSIMQPYPDDLDPGQCECELWNLHWLGTCR
mmetsp:Transcript_199/g.653  ORF Transcript_199/g.653 Transcript_199/m.653 type:complete len:947 (-) Transcript_199:56-2896(-)